MKKVKLFAFAALVSLQALVAANAPIMGVECKILLEKDEYIRIQEENFVKISIMKSIIESDTFSPQSYAIEFKVFIWTQCPVCNVYYNAAEGGCKNANCSSHMN